MWKRICQWPNFHKHLFLQIVLISFFSVWDLIVIAGHQHGLPVHEATVAKFLALLAGQFLYMMADLFWHLAKSYRLRLILK